MSGFGAGVGKAVGSLGGPQIAAIVVAGGLLVGAVGGGLVGGGGSGQQGTSQATLSIYPCPDSGPALATVGSGQKFLVTGRNADGSWARIYYPLPGRTEAWVLAGPLQVDGSLDSQPVVPCAPVVAAAGASVEPSSSLTAIENNSPSPGPTPEPTVTPNGGPSLARLATGSGTIAGGPQRYCTKAARSVTFSVRVTEPDPIASVVLSYRKPGASDFATKRMTRSGGSDTWQATLATDADGISGPGSLRFYVSATDAAADPGAARLPATGSRTIDVADCSNDGPTLASLRAAPGTVSTNVAACQSKPKATTISVDASDVDGVADVTLHYRLPGDGSFRDVKMAKSGNRWRATVTPVNQRPNADGKATYYITGDDDLGESTKSATRSFTVNRCNFAPVIGSLNWDVSPSCASAFGLHATVSNASDRDGLGAQSARVVYKFTLKGGKRKTGRKTLNQDQVIRENHRYSTVVNFQGLEPGSVVTAYVTLTDKYGDTTKLKPVFGPPLSPPVPGC